MEKNICPVERQRFSKKGGLVGLASGIVASLCCVTPVVLILFGLGSVSFAFSFLGLKPYFLAGSIILLVISFVVYAKKRKCGFKVAIKSPFMITAIITTVVLFIGIFYGLLPLVSPYVFEQKLFLSQDIQAHPEFCHLQLEVSADPLVQSCVSCEAALRYSLQQAQGVSVAEVDLSSDQILVHYDQEIISSEKIIEIVSIDVKIKNIAKQCS